MRALVVDLSVRDGGAERQTAALLAGLARGGNLPLGIVRRGSPLERRCLASGAPIFPLGPRFPAGPSGILTPWSRRRGRAAAAAEWDVVHAASPESIRGARVLVPHAGRGRGEGIPLVVSYRGGGGGSMSITALRRAARDGVTIAASSEALWSALVRSGFEEGRLRVVHPGIDLTRFAPPSPASRSGAAPAEPPREAARRALGIGAGEEAVGTAAILDRERGIGRLLEAAAILAADRPSLRIVVAGDGPHRPALEERARAAGVAPRTIFTGWREDVPALLQALDIFVFCGEGEEVFPLALVEAMASAVPVVASDQPGIREIMENGKQGLFVPERGAASLARTIGRYLADPAGAAAIGRAGSVRVQRFHAQAMIDATENLYRRVVRREPPS